MARSEKTNRLDDLRSYVVWFDRHDPEVFHRVREELVPDDVELAARLDELLKVGAYTRCGAAADHESAARLENCQRMTYGLPWGGPGQCEFSRANAGREADRLYDAARKLGSGPALGILAAPLPRR